MLMFIVAHSIAAVISALVWGDGDMYFVLNFPGRIAVSLLIPFVVFNLGREGVHPSQWYASSASMLFIAVGLVGLVGIIQVAEFHGYIPRIGVNSTLSTVYPYRGELSASVLEKTQGYTIRMGGLGRATATFEGHPILFADFLAFALVVVLPFMKSKWQMLFYAGGTVALLLTLSRGAIIGWLTGVMIVIVLSVYFGKRAPIRVRRQIILPLLISGTIIVGVVLGTPLGESVMYRIESTLYSLQGFGRPEQRLATIWPAAFEALWQAEVLGWFVGVPGGYEGPTDSQYLWLLVNVGLLGCVVFVSFHFLVLRRGLKLSASGHKLDRVAGISAVAGVCALLAMYITHPSLQGDRLTTALIVMIGFLHKPQGKEQSRGAH